MLEGRYEMDPLDEVVARIRRFCEMSADEKIVAKYSRFFREGYDAYGVRHEDISKEAKRILAQYRVPLGLWGFLDLSDLLMRTGKYEESCFVILFVAAFKKQFSRQVFERIGTWFDGKVQNWAISDGICRHILWPMLGPSVVTLSDLAAWRESPNKWKRRAVPVTLLVLLKSPFPVTELLDFIRPMMLDRERVVHQGLGWFLREAWRKHPKEVEDFLLEWKDSAARLIFRYATEKMSPEDKARFRRTRRTKT